MVVARRIVGAVPTGTRTTVAVVLDGVAAARPWAAAAVVVSNTVVATTVVTAVGTAVVSRAMRSPCTTTGRSSSRSRMPGPGSATPMPRWPGA
jgi:hypothetical protein